MRKKALWCLAILVCLVLVGCSSGSDDGGGGSTGGSGTLAACEERAGVYRNPDGSRVEIMPNCEFIVTLPDGSYGHGIYTHISDERITLDLVIDTGPSKGTCATGSLTDDGLTISNVRQCA